MAVGERRVGVVSENVSLVVALSLQGHGYDVSRAPSVAMLDGFDVGLVDLPTVPQATDELGDAPTGVAVVVIADEFDVTGADVVVQRPYAMADLLAALARATSGVPVPTSLPTVGEGDRELLAATTSDIITDDPPATTDVRPPATSPRRSRRRRRREAGPSDAPENGDDGIQILSEPPAPPEEPAPEPPAPPTAPPPAPSTPAPAPPSRFAPDHLGVADVIEASGPSREMDPVAPLELFAGRVPQVSQAAVAPPVPAPPVEVPPPFAEAPSVSDIAAVGDPITAIATLSARLVGLLADAPFLRTVPDLADALARALRTELGANSVAFWQQHGEHLGVLGASGLTDGERRLRVHHRHPMLEQAVATSSVVVENADVGGALTIGLPGARDVGYAVVLLGGPGMPVDMVTVGAHHLEGGVIGRVEAFVAESRSGFAAAAAVEELRAQMSH